MLEVPPPPEGYELCSSEDGAEHYVAEDGSTYYRWVFGSYGPLMREGWRCPIGRPHRIGGLPALVRYTNTGEILEQEWLVDGRRSRLDGPARIEYERVNDLTVESWNLSGVHASAGDLSGVLTVLPAADLEREIACSVFARLSGEGVGIEQIVAAISDGIYGVEGVRAYAAGAPKEWIRSFEDGEELAFNTDR